MLIENHGSGWRRKKIRKEFKIFVWLLENTRSLCVIPVQENILSLRENLKTRENSLGNGDNSVKIQDFWSCDIYVITQKKRTKILLNVSEKVLYTLIFLSSDCHKSTMPKCLPKSVFVHIHVLCRITFTQKQSFK